MKHRHDHVWTEDHIYLGPGHARAESRTWFVVWLTAAFMGVEIAAGIVFGSMAVLADGVHMATHVGALGLAAFAYWMARRHAKNRRFSFGSGKFGDLAGFTSALVLGLVAIAVAVESATRLYEPVSIQYTEAIIVAAIGLLINIASAAALHGADEIPCEDDDHEGHEHGHSPGHSHARDNNLRAAYLHVLADAATSVLALAALIAGEIYGLAMLDPIAGMLGAVMIARWSAGLLRQTAFVLLDVEDDPALAEAIRKTLGGDLGLAIADMHLWRLGPGHRGLIVSLIAKEPRSADEIKSELRRRHTGLSHVTVELAVCPECTLAKSPDTVPTA